MSNTCVADGEKHHSFEAEAKAASDRIIYALTFDIRRAAYYRQSAASIWSGGRANKKLKANFRPLGSKKGAACGSACGPFCFIVMYHYP